MLGMAIVDTIVRESRLTVTREVEGSRKPTRDEMMSTEIAKVPGLGKKK